MNDCLFCKIINKEIPAQIVYEDNNVLAFLDINPVNPGHTLIVPKKHCENLLDASGEDLRTLISVAPKIARAILDSLGYSAFNFGVNNGGVAGQVISHLHFHVMPRRPDDGYKLFAGKPYEAGEMEKAATAIRNKLT